MKKIFPIKVEKATKINYKYIDWRIHNVCTYDCSFCAPENKNGIERWSDLQTYKNQIDKIAQMCEGHPFWIQINGGEPTLYPEIIELIKYMKLKGAFVSMISNGVRTYRWWENLRNSIVLDALYLSFHCEQTNDYQHFVNVINLFHDAPTSVVCVITHTKDNIDLAFRTYDELIEHTGATITVKAMRIGNYDIYKYYTSEQLEKLKSALGAGKKPDKMPTAGPQIGPIVNITYNDGTSIEMHHQNVMKNRINYFKDWSCYVGQDTMRINKDVIYRGACGVGETRNLNDENLSFTTDAITCTAPECFCALDLVSKKILPEDKYPK